jgi:hypothetical protein
MVVSPGLSIEVVFRAASPPRYRCGQPMKALYRIPMSR